MLNIKKSLLVWTSAALLFTSFSITVNAATWQKGIPEVITHQVDSHRTPFIKLHNSKYAYYRNVLTVEGSTGSKGDHGNIVYNRVLYNKNKKYVKQDAGKKLESQRTAYPEYKRLGGGKYIIKPYKPGNSKLRFEVKNLSGSANSFGKLELWFNGQYMGKMDDVHSIDYLD
ncbi:hypothetical protein [Lactobacillus sp. Sy-1]|uniref:hypothetical protein n=1 Tax=Lactobacillus sp. Sy-1 TaxID=2109645 RepID=UPI001C5A7FAF|nr:hypothetical protein [Lactobacillus sp. Sy-1]MBW1606065.1 hypothetical protein [Lactobacillus sp. Sy-1]